MSQIQHFTSHSQSSYFLWDQWTPLPVWHTSPHSPRQCRLHQSRSRSYHVHLWRQSSDILAKTKNKCSTRFYYEIRFCSSQSLWNVWKTLHFAAKRHVVNKSGTLIFYPLLPSCFFWLLSKKSIANWTPFSSRPEKPNHVCYCFVL